MLQAAREAAPMPGLDPRVARLKERLLTAPYEVCLARALHFTRSYRETEGMDPALRNARALRRTLEQQRIFIAPDERIAGSKTEKNLAAPLSVERGDFLRTLQMEMDVLHLKRRPFQISDEERRLFWEEILPYWDGRTLRDHKARVWEERGIIETRPSFVQALRAQIDGLNFVRALGRSGLRSMLGANLRARRTLRRTRNLYALRYELARNNPTPATYVFDVQGHLSLGVEKAVAHGMDSIIAEARARMAQPDVDRHARDFLQAVIVSLEAAIAYAGRFAALAEQMAGSAADEAEKTRLLAIASACRQVPRLPPRTFQEALQSVWMTHVVGEIQYGTHEVFADGRVDQYLYPYLRDDLAAGRIDREEAIALVQEYYLKLSANVEPIPEAGMETNAVLGNSQHVVTIGGLTPLGEDATNALTWLMLEAHERMGGAINQLSVRIHRGSPPELLRRTSEVFRSANGISIYNDDAIVPALRADGLSEEDARDYCVVGCIETSGHGDTHGCPGGHEISLPAVLMLTLTRGRRPYRILGQQRGFDSGDPRGFQTFKDLMTALKRQLGHQLGVLIDATEGKDRAYRDVLPAPYVSALMDGCIERARDITDGGARYDFTSIDMRGLGTLVDSLAALRSFVFERNVLSLMDLLRALETDFRGQEVLRQRLIHEPPKFGMGDARADDLALEIVGWIHEEAGQHRNLRGGRFRCCYYSYGNHVLDGFMLGATPDGRRAGSPISNGVSPSNLIDSHAGPTGSMRSVARLPPEKISSGVSLNLRFHPNFIRHPSGIEAFAGMIRTYFDLGGMHLQPNVVSTETLRDAQAHPEAYRDLIVKVSGYSAYFTDLGRSIQEDIIARAEFGR